MAKKIKEVDTKLKINDIKKNSSNEVGHVITKIKLREKELTIIWVIIILIFLSIFLYMTFSSVQKVKKFNTLKSGSLVMNYNELETGMGDVVTIVSKNGLSDKDGLKELSYSFKITNKSKKDVLYRIILEEDNEMIEVDGCRETLFEKENVRFSINSSKIKSLADVFEKDRYVLASGKILAFDTKEYELKIWDAEKKVHSTKHFHGKIVVENIKKEHE